MKSKLKRIKTTYDDEAKYDNEAYETEKVKIYQRQISLATKIDAITDKQFALKPLEIGFINSIALKDEPKFKEIKKIYYDYNKEISQYIANQPNEQDQKAIKGFHLRKTVMDSMMKFVRLMLLAPGMSAKLKILDVAHHWFILNLDPKSKRKNKKQLQREIKTIAIEKELLPIDIINRELLATKLKEESYHYKIKARTLYDELDPPSQELENYHTHKLGLGDIDNEKKVKQKKKWVESVKFPKIQLPAYYYDDDQKEEAKQEEKAKQLEKQPEKEEKNFQTEGTAQQTDGQEKPPAEENVAEQVQLDFGVKEEDQGEQEVEEEPQDKKKGKLDPLVKAFMRQRQLLKQKSEYNAERREEKIFNKNNQQIREDFSSVNYMKAWGAYRARSKMQLARKHESAKGLMKRFQNKPQKTVSGKYIENEMSDIKKNKIIKEHEKKLQEGEFFRENLNTEPGVTYFDRRRVKTEAAQKPFSAILNEHSKQSEEELALNEITQIKDQFSKYKIYTPLQNLMKGLANRPQKEEQEGQLTLPPCQLMSNPFIKLGKKKKKKKKKR